MASNPGAISQLSGLFGGSGTPTQNTAAPQSNVGMGSNQYMNYPSPQSMGGPGTVPGQSPISTGSGPNNTTNAYGAGNTGAEYGFGGDIPGTNSQHMVPTNDPSFTQAFYNMLQGQLGQGLPGFNLQTLLPSSGQATGAGQLNAPLNSTDQALQQFLAGGQSNIPGANQLTQMAQTGNPIDQTPAWQAMIASQQQNTAQNANDLREQFAFGGDLKSSPFGGAMQNFYNQNAMNQNAQLTQAQSTAQENAQQRMLQAGQGIQNEAGQFGQQMQTMDQQAIQNMLNEFNYTLPQNNPMNQMFEKGALASPNTVGADKATFLTKFNDIMQSLSQL